MKLPVVVNVILVSVGATAMYTVVGQLVPQKEVHPPQVVEIAKDVTSEEMVAIGQEIFVGKGLCSTCHTIGKSGALRFPDLAGIATRAENEVPGLNALDYLSQSLYDPEAYIVPGFNPGMPVINKPPIGLTDDEILTVMAYLQSLGGTPTVTMETRLPFSPDGPPPGSTGTDASSEETDAEGEVPAVPADGGEGDPA